MIIIPNKNIENTVYFPRNVYTSNTSIYTLVLNDRATNRKHITQIPDKHVVQFGFYTFSLDFNKLPQGEYEYSIIDSNDKVVGTGLIRLNELESNNVYYNNERTYIAYDGQ